MFKIRFIYVLPFFKASYHRLSQFGLCGVAGSPVAHEQCQRINMDGDVESTCQSYCSTDSFCKGFVFSTNQCTVYTTATCRSEYTKLSKGVTGDLIQDTIYLAHNLHQSGCFKKTGGNKPLKFTN